jgi:hypothetical protein
VAFLFSGAVLPEYCRRDAHRALIHARLVAAMSEGLSFAAAWAVPGSASERHLQRGGLDPLYVRETWVRS